MNVFDAEAIPYRWLVAVLGEEEAAFLNAHPEHMPPDITVALLALLDATATKLPRSR